MKHSLVGYTGFVGGNLAACHKFDNLYNSANIKTAFGAQNGLVVYSAMPAEKFLANAEPAADFALAQNAFENIKKMRPEKLVLISTVDVYPRPIKVYEDSPNAKENTPAYGKNRLALEGFVRQEFKDALIIRLPGLFGQGIKKNFIYDMLNPVPSVLTLQKFEELAKTQPMLGESYAKDKANFYRIKPQSPQNKALLRQWFEENSFNSLCFTDSRSVYQFYDLAMLWVDIERCLKQNLKLVNFATPPIEAGALYQLLFGKEFFNHTQKGAVHYDMRTRYGRDFGADDDYIVDRNGLVAGIARFVAANMGKV